MHGVRIRPSDWPHTATKKNPRGSGGKVAKIAPAIPNLGILASSNRERRISDSSRSETLIEAARWIRGEYTNHGGVQPTIDRERGPCAHQLPADAGSLNVRQQIDGVQLGIEPGFRRPNVATGGESDDAAFGQLRDQNVRRCRRIIAQSASPGGRSIVDRERVDVLLVDQAGIRRSPRCDVNRGDRVRIVGARASNRQA